MDKPPYLMSDGMSEQTKELLDRMIEENHRLRSVDLDLQQTKVKLARVEKSLAEFSTGSLIHSRRPPTGALACTLLQKIQIENLWWCRKNFPGQMPWQPLLGIVEELSELHAAQCDEDLLEVGDSIGDVMIFMANFCNHFGWDLQELYDSRGTYRSGHANGLRFAGMLAHHYLKMSQNIRGECQQHLGSIKVTLIRILCYLEQEADPLYEKGENIDLPEIAHNVWEKVVKKRDWRSEGGEYNEP